MSESLLKKIKFNTSIISGCMKSKMKDGVHL